MAYAIGNVSGCHPNPAVSLEPWAGKRFPAKELLPYIVVQIIRRMIVAGVLLVIASGKPGFDLGAGFAANGFAEHSPGGARRPYFRDVGWRRLHREAVTGQSVVDAARLDRRTGPSVRQCPPRPPRLRRHTLVCP